MSEMTQDSLVDVAEQIDFTASRKNSNFYAFGDRATGSDEVKY